MKKRKINKEIILKCLTGEAKEADMKWLLNWLESDPRNPVEYNRFKEVWEAIEVNGLKSSNALEKSWKKFEQRVINKNKKRKICRIQFIRAAASIAILLGIGSVLYLLLSDDLHKKQTVTSELRKPYIISSNGKKHILNPGKQTIRYDEILDLVSDNQEQQKHTLEQEMNELIVPRGYRINLELSDGSVVWLNSETRLRYPLQFAGDTRRLCLTGEGFFKVKHSDTKPFIVETTNLEIEVLGTSFNVSAFDNENQITTTLIEGSVRLHTTNNQEDIILKPNQCGVYSLSDHEIQVHDVDTELNTSWIKDYYTFKSENLDIVIQKLVRSYGIPISITDQELKKFKFSGKLDMKDTLYEVLEVLKLAAPIEYRETNGKIVIQNKNE
ncbi:MAG: FecR domain-containing protein [Bacteroidetes bacterium]|nr:FecR domain-containing protein [Bacteroidota bacterium]